MRSMTGYGQGESVFDGLKITVELSAVNRKQAEVVVSLPRELDMLESPVREELNRHISRGRVTARVLIQAKPNRTTSHLRVNTELAAEYLREIQRAAKALKMDASVTIETVLRAPGVVEVESALQDPEAVWNAIHPALKQAIRRLVAMRDREGKHLAQDLKRRISLAGRAVSRIRKRAPQVLKRYREALRRRVAEAGVDLAESDDERLLKELVYFSDRSDISEELTRLESHFQQFQDCLNTREPVGRKLDFLVQEMNREVNTIGSKANDTEIAREVVLLKTELERFREQAQNVE